jgi:hypothetical protein
MRPGTSCQATIGASLRDGHRFYTKPGTSCEASTVRLSLRAIPQENRERPIDYGGQAADRLVFADRPKPAHQEAGWLPEIEIPISDVDDAVTLKKEVGSQQSAKWIGQIFRSFRQRSHADDHGTEIVPPDLQLRRDRH